MTENVPTILPSANEFQMFQTIAKYAQSSGLYSGVGQESKIFMVLLAARELGISPMLALNGGIWNIQGKIEISARLMNSLIRRAGHSIKIVRSDDHVCTLLGKRSDGDSFECTFTIEEAARAGLSSRDVWKKYTGDMLYNRCMSRLARRLFPDVIGNCYVEGEIREAKEVEKLEQVECEEIHTSRSIPEPEKPSIPQTEPAPETINEEQFKEINEMFLQTDEGFQKNFLDNIKTYWNANSLSELPVKYFQSSMSRIAMTLSNRNTAEVAA